MVVILSISCMQWPVTPHTYRRSKDGTPYHGRADTRENRVGDPTPTGRDSGGVPGGGLYLLARPRATPVTTIQLFLFQMLHGNTACSHLPHLSGLRFSASASSQARARLPLRFFDLVLERFNRAVQRSAVDDGRWHGHRTFLVDGSSCSMPESAGPPGRVRPVDGAAAGVRRSRGAPVGAVPCQHRGAPQAHRRTPADP
jgi:hypothetical protein